MKKSLQKSTTTICLIIFTLFTTQSFSQIYLDSTQSVSTRVEDLLSKMTLEEKIGQMVQMDTDSKSEARVSQYQLGSLLCGGWSFPVNNAQIWIDNYNKMQAAALTTRLKIPLIYGVDAVHGHSNLYGATIFPHNIGLGCSRDSVIVEKCAMATAIETKATGLHWTFSPCVTVPRDIRWGRNYEGFGETPEIQKMMSGAMIRGYQGDSLGTPNRILACAKHFLGDGGTTDGINFGNTVLSENDLRKIHLPGYIKAINAGVGSIMVSFNKWNGELCHGNKYLITDLLKGELNFKGFVVSDWEGIVYLSNDLKTSINISVNAGIDMFMEPAHGTEFGTLLKQLVDEGNVEQSRIDDAARRILTAKFKLGLFENPFISNSMIDSIGNSFHRSIAREAVRKSIVLLKNETNILPLSKTNGKILLVGSKANDIGSQCGGWTIKAHGDTGAITIGTTILEAFKNVRGESNIIYSKNGTTSENAYIAVIVVGEIPYGETPGYNANPQLTNEELTIISNVKNSGLPYVVLLLSGRPVIMNDVIADAKTFVACWLPGTEASGITDVLFGDYDFTGKLSQTWPNSISQEPINWGDVPYTPLFAYDYGLTYKNNSIPIIEEENFSIFPNPANDYLFINSKYKGKIEIFNSIGQLQKKFNINQYYSKIDISNLENGLYIIKMETIDGSKVVNRFIKN
jgi:beta-glucosidase